MATMSALWGFKDGEPIRTFGRMEGGGYTGLWDAANGQWLEYVEGGDLQLVPAGTWGLAQRAITKLEVMVTLRRRVILWAESSSGLGYQSAISFLLITAVGG